jgi:hypothetical protein
MEAAAAATAASTQVWLALCLFIFYNIARSIEATSHAFWDCHLN